MKTIFEEYGGVLLACIASLAVLTMNMAFFLGPVTEGITLIVKQCY